MEDKIERSIFKTNLVPVLPKKLDRKRKQYTPRYSRVMDNTDNISKTEHQTKLQLQSKEEDD